MIFEYATLKNRRMKFFQKTASPRTMKENFLHFLWHRRRFDSRLLMTTQGQNLDIFHPGEPNEHAGPDFFNARLRIADTQWAGNVEIHVRASEWSAHGHNRDPAYDNVVLHVVWEEDEPVCRSNGERIPCLELKDRTSIHLLDIYQRLAHGRAWIPCQAFFAQAPGIVRLNWLDRMLAERLEYKTELPAAQLSATAGHWEETFYRVLARSFGLNVNAEPFESLARAVPLSLLARHKNNLVQLEALLMGQAGWLGGPFSEPYPQLLAREYRHLQHKYELTPLAAGQWKFGRLRPANFPTVRVAQFAALVHRSAHLFSTILETERLRDFEHLLDVVPGEYWHDHFQLDKPSIRREKRPGRDFVHLLLINTVGPCLFYYGKTQGRPDLQQRALHLLEALPPERNTLLDGWAKLGVDAQHAYHSQALLHLKTRYCDERRCLECAIGNAFLK